MLDHHAAQARIEVVEPARLVAQHEAARRGVVGDRVDDVDVPVRDPAADDLDRGDGIVDGAGHVGDRRQFHVEIVAEDEGDFALDARL